MYFPISGVEVSPVVLFCVAFFVSFITSMGGVSGAFLLLPFQMSFLGYTAPSVSATNQVYNIVAIPSGIWGFIQEKRMVWPLAWIVVLGTVPGVVGGALVRIFWLPNPDDFRFFAGCVLFYMGARLLWDFFSKQRKKRHTNACQQPFSTENLSFKRSDNTSKTNKTNKTNDSLNVAENKTAQDASHAVSKEKGQQCLVGDKSQQLQRHTCFAINAFERLRLSNSNVTDKAVVKIKGSVSDVVVTCRLLSYTFAENRHSCSVPAVFLLCLVVGMVGGAYGIGGGAIIAPFLVSVFELPIYTVAGASLLGTLVTSMVSVVFYMGMSMWYPHLSIAPDWLLGGLLGLGGMAGIYLGARVQRYVSSVFICWLLALILLGTAVSYIL